MAVAVVDHLKSELNWSREYETVGGPGWLGVQGLGPPVRGWVALPGVPS